MIEDSEAAEFEGVEKYEVTSPIQFGGATKRIEVGETVWLTRELANSMPNAVRLIGFDPVEQAKKMVTERVERIHSGEPKTAHQ